MTIEQPTTRITRIQKFHPDISDGECRGLLIHRYNELFASGVTHPDAIQIGLDDYTRKLQTLTSIQMTALVQEVQKLFKKPLRDL